MNTDLTEYIEQHTTPEPEVLRRITRHTNLEVLNPHMLSGHVQGRLLSMLSQMIRPRRILELGTFTGYSALCLAEGLAPDGTLTTIEHNDELEDTIRHNLSLSPLGTRINLIIADAKEYLTDLANTNATIDSEINTPTTATLHEVLNTRAASSPHAVTHVSEAKAPATTTLHEVISASATLPDTGAIIGEPNTRYGVPLSEGVGGVGTLFDLVFIDADKREYCAYLDLVYPLVCTGGWILADNTLWDGHIIDPAYDHDKQTLGLRAFNDKLACDNRFSQVILPLRDGLTIIHKL